MQGDGEQLRSKAIENMENGTHGLPDQGLVSVSGNKPSIAGMLPLMLIAAMKHADVCTGSQPCKANGVCI